MKNTYNSYAKEYDKNTHNYLIDFIHNETDIFLNELKGRRILDLGSGPGRDSLYFKEKGFESICFDNSQEMLDLCQNKELTTKLGDMLEPLPFKDNTFDGIWAYLSIFRTIRKKEVYPILKEIERILKPQGLLFVGVREGKLEEIREDLRYPHSKRLDVFYTHEEMKKYLQKDFKILIHSKTPVENKIYLNYLCSPKST